MIGIGADRVLIGAGAISEERYLHAFAAALDVPFEPLDDVVRAQCPLSDERLIESAAAGILPLMDNDELCLVVAPRGMTAHRFARGHANNSALVRRFRFTTAERLNRFVLRHGGKAMTDRAANKLKQSRPMLSAAPPRWRGHAVSAALAAALALAAGVMVPALAQLAVDVTLATVFLAWLALRFSVALVARHPDKSQPPLADDALPVYTIIAALYREAKSVGAVLWRKRHKMLGRLGSPR